MFAFNSKTDISDIVFLGEWDKGIITTEDIYCLGREYEKGNFHAGDNYFGFLDKRVVNFWKSSYKSDLYIVKGEDGTDDYFCISIFIGNSYHSSYPCLESRLTGYQIEIDGDMEALEKYMQTNDKIRRMVSKKAAYIKENIDSSQHGGYYYCQEYSGNKRPGIQRLYKFY